MFKMLESFALRVSCVDPRYSGISTSPLPIDMDRNVAKIIVRMSLANTEFLLRSDHRIGDPRRRLGFLPSPRELQDLFRT